MMMTISRGILFYLLLGIGSWASAAEISMSVDRNPVATGESFRILLESTEDVDADPDFSPLEKDFTILGTARSSNTSIVNGKVTHSNQWIVTVMAKKEGTLSIPSVRFGKDRSQPGTITVVAGGSGSSQRSGDIFLEVEVTNEEPYVQAQVVYTVRLYRSVSISNASLSEPETGGGNAVIERLGDDRSYEVKKVGIRYMVIERKYAIFPQASGDITIEPVTFQGQVGRDTGFFIDPFGPPPRVVVEKSRPVVLHVKPIPATFTGKQWLPLRNLELTEQWSHDPLSLPEGEPATRTLRVIASDLTASQLPDLDSALPESLKQYPDQPILNNIMNTEGITGSREEKTAIIPAQAGDYRLPAIEIPWWNTRTDKQEMAILPERTITVLSAATSKDSPADVKTEPQENATAGETPLPSPGKPETEDRYKEWTGDRWVWISIVLATGWFVTLLLWWRFAARRHETTGTTPRQDNIRRAVNDVRQACQRNDAAAAKDAVLRWAGMRWPESPPVSLGQLEKCVTGRLSEQLRLLGKTLYSADHQGWNGSDFLQAFDAAMREVSQAGKTQPDPLEPLFRL